MDPIMIDVHAVLRKLKPAIEPALKSGVLTPNDAQRITETILLDPQLLFVVQHIHEKPNRDYFVGFDCLTTTELNQLIDDMIDSNGEDPIEWSVATDSLTIHCLNQYVADNKTLAQSPNGQFFFTEREGTADTYLIIEVPETP